MWGYPMTNKLEIHGLDLSKIWDGSIIGDSMEVGKMKYVDLREMVKQLVIDVLDEIGVIEVSGQLDPEDEDDEDWPMAE